MFPRNICFDSRRRSREYELDRLDHDSNFTNSSYPQNARRRFDNNDSHAGVDYYYKDWCNFQQKMVPLVLGLLLQPRLTVKLYISCDHIHILVLIPYISILHWICLPSAFKNVAGQYWERHDRERHDREWTIPRMVIAENEHYWEWPILRIDITGNERLTLPVCDTSLPYSRPRINSVGSVHSQ